MAWCQTGDKPSPETMLTKVSNVMVSLGHNELRPGTPVLEVIFNKYSIFEFSTGNSFLLLGL